MTHSISQEDNNFRKEVESCVFRVSTFNHKAHLRLAYIYLAEKGAREAVTTMRGSLIKLLQHAGIEPSSKYHETMTKAWILAVHHFMNSMHSSTSFDEFIEHNSILMDSKIMMSHYSKELLFSDKARKEFIRPNLKPIPLH